MLPTTRTISEGISPTYPQHQPADTKHALLRMMQQGQSINLVGPAGCGKTHLLRAIACEASLDIPDVPLPVYLDLMPLRDAGEEEHLARLAGALVRALRRAGSVEECSSIAPRARDLIWLHLLAVLGMLTFPAVRVCYALDHFECAARNRRLSPNFFSALRGLCSQPRVSLICASRAPLWQFERLVSRVGSTFPNVFLTWEVSADGGL